jgi:hypothetical protein
MDNWPGSGRDSLSEPFQNNLRRQVLNGPTRKQAKDRTSMGRRVGRVARLSLYHTVFTEYMQNIENINKNRGRARLSWERVAWQFFGLRISRREVVQHSY